LCGVMSQVICEMTWHMWVVWGHVSSEMWDDMTYVRWHNMACSRLSMSRERVMSYSWMSHVTCTNESCHLYEWGMSHVRMSHVTCTNESCHMYEWVMSHSTVTHDGMWPDTLYGVATVSRLLKITGLFDKRAL